MGYEDLVGLSKKFHFVRKFSLSGTRLIMWNDRKILVGSIGDVETQMASQTLTVKKLDLEISRDLDFSNSAFMRSGKNQIRKTMSSKNISEADGKLTRGIKLEMMARESDDFFD